MPGSTRKIGRGAVGSAHPYWLPLFFVAPALLWWLASALAIVDVEAANMRRICRNLGYGAAIALVVPYLYLWRRATLHKSRGNLTRWLRWHIGASYLALALTLIHSRGSLFGTPLTTWIVVLFLLIIVSGMAGLLLHKLVNRMAALLLDREIGLERLEAERLKLMANAGMLVKNYSLLTVFDITDWPEFCRLLQDKESKLHEKVWAQKWFARRPKEAIEALAETRKADPERTDVVVKAINVLLQLPEFCRTADFGDVLQTEEVYPLLKRKQRDLSQREVERRNRLYLERLCPDLILKSQPPPVTVVRFFEEMVERCLRADFPSWSWLFSSAALEPVSENHYLRARTLVASEQTGLIDQLWEWVRERRQLDMEYWFHRLARVWLLVHGPAAWALLVLVLIHIVSSIYYGGFL